MHAVQFHGPAVIERHGQVAGAAERIRRVQIIAGKDFPAIHRHDHIAPFQPRRLRRTAGTGISHHRHDPAPLVVIIIQLVGEAEGTALVLSDQIVRKRLVIGIVRRPVIDLPAGCGILVARIPDLLLCIPVHLPVVQLARNIFLPQIVVVQQSLRKQVLIQSLLVHFGDFRNFGNFGDFGDFGDIRSRGIGLLAGEQGQCQQACEQESLNKVFHIVIV